MSSVFSKYVLTYFYTSMTIFYQIYFNLLLRTTFDKDISWKETDSDLDVFAVGRLQFLSEVRVRLQHLDHLSEVPVVVQARVLRGCVVEGELITTRRIANIKKYTDETSESITPFSSGTSALASWFAALRSTGTDRTPAQTKRSSSQPGWRFILLQYKQCMSNAGQNNHWCFMNATVICFQFYLELKTFYFNKILNSTKLWIFQE